MELDNSEVYYSKQNGVDLIKFRVFDQEPGVTAAFAIAGFRDTDYAHPPMNYSRLADAVGVNFESIVNVEYQDHGDDIDRIDSIADFPTHVDAVVTNVPGISLTIRTADCIAVLIYDPVNHAIANVHSGWRGTLLRIAPKTIQRMHQEFGTNPEDVIVVLCPSIGPDHFEVMEDVRSKFEAEYGLEHIKDGENGHFLIDSPACVVDSLVEIGVPKEKIHLSNLCTVCHQNVLHSYRSTYGDDKKMRNVALICLK
jgi:hypothetical protein